MDEVLHFLNKLDFNGYLENEENEKFSCIKKVLTSEYQHLDSEKLLNMLGVNDDLYFLFITQAFQDLQILTNVLRENFFSPVKLSNN